MVWHVSIAACFNDQKQKDPEKYGLKKCRISCEKKITVFGICL